MQAWDIEEVLGAGLADVVKRGFAVVATPILSAMMAAGSLLAADWIGDWVPAFVDRWLRQWDGSESVNVPLILFLLVVMVISSILFFSKEELFPKLFLRVVSIESISMLLIPPGYDWTTIVALGLLIGMLGSMWHLSLVHAQMRRMKFESELMELARENQLRRMELEKQLVSGN